VGKFFGLSYSFVVGQLVGYGAFFGGDGEERDEDE